MSDRYLYRAKRKNWRELQKEKWWVTGYLVNKKCGKYNTVGFEEFEEMVIVTQFSDGGIDWCYIDKDTICQCTGLKDKNGKLIWENDIVKPFSDLKGIVKFGESDYSREFGFYIEWMSKSCYRKDFLYWAEKCEVIGSAIDNPELLEVNYE